MGASEDDSAITQVILLVHGIRTQADWDERIKRVLETPGTRVTPVKYGFFDLLRFLWPFEGSKRKPVKLLEDAIEYAESEYKGAKISILAHSFGCYVVGRLLKEEKSLALHRLVLCGSVLKRDYDWIGVKHRIGAIVNDCGWRDIWPVIAETVTWDYGSSGRAGFLGGGPVEERDHDLAHSDFLTKGFAERYWRPFFADGKIVRGQEDQPTTPWLVSLVGVVRLRYFIVAALLLGLLWLSTPWLEVPDLARRAIAFGAVGVPLVLLVVVMMILWIARGWSTHVPLPPDEEPLPAHGSSTRPAGRPAPIRHAELFPNHPRLEWDLPDLGQGAAAGYELRLSRASDFGERVARQVLRRPFAPLAKIRESIRELGAGEGPIYWSVRMASDTGGGSGWTDTSSFSLYHDVIDRIKQRGKLRIGVSKTQEDLFSYTDSTGEWEGIDIDLVRKLIPFLGVELGVPLAEEPEIEMFPWSFGEGGDASQVTLWQAATRRRVDFVISSVTAKPERMARHGVVFTRPYFEACQTIVSAPGNPIASVEALRGKRIGGQGGTTNWEYAAHLRTSVEAYSGEDSLSEMIRALLDGELDAFFLDEPFVRMRNRSREAAGLPRLEMTPLEPATLAAAGFPAPHAEPYAIVLHPLETELKELLDRGILELETSGFLGYLQQKARHEPGYS